MCQLKAAQNRFELQFRKKVERKSSLLLPPVHEGGDIGIEESNEFLKRPKERRISRSLTSLPPLGAESTPLDTSNVNASERSSGLKRAPSDPVLLRCNSESPGDKFSTEGPRRRRSYAGINVVTKATLL